MKESLEVHRLLENLEKRLADHPNDSDSANKLIFLLDLYMPSKKGFGAYTHCQQEVRAQLLKYGSPNDILKRGKVPQYIKDSLSLFDSMNVRPPTTVRQLFSGSDHTIDGEQMNCDERMLLFNKEGVIPRTCHDCFKVQILPTNFAAFIQTHFIIRGLKLPRDNRRKCMVEVRKDIPNPYKGYIYCESEDEAIFCLEACQKALQAIGLINVYCGISHGCSEYSLKYPEFKYSTDGAHRLFERPTSWDQTESEFISKNPMPGPEPDWVDDSNQSITIKDIVAFQTWIIYAQIIGDFSCNIFLDGPTTTSIIGIEPFAMHVRKQTQQRKAEIEELRERIFTST